MSMANTENFGLEKIEFCANGLNTHTFYNNRSIKNIQIACKMPELTSLQNVYKNMC